MKAAGMHAALFFVPMILANVLHMVVVKLDLLRGLAIPVSARLFGRNKTLRGFLFVPLAGGVLAWAGSRLAGPFCGSHAADLGVGAGLGLCYVLFELPNSLVKRRLGIPSGGSLPRYRRWQLLADKTDSLFGICLFYYLAAPVDLPSVLAIFTLSLALHVGISQLLVVSGIKASL